MRAIYVANVGDGLCVALHTVAGKTIQIDCGSNKGGDTALEGWERCYSFFGSPSVFILSHFHVDHYNGLLPAPTHKGHPYFGAGIKKVYYPGLPEFKDNKEFICALFAINLRVFGRETGSMECDFLNAIYEMTLNRFSYQRLFKDDRVNIDGSTFEVLWPPRRLGRGTPRKVKKALEDFHEALEGDDELKEIHKRITEGNIFDRYFGEKMERYYQHEPEGKSDREGMEYRNGKLPKATERANKSLKKAANNLSLALSEDDRFLFLGDVEGHEIKQIVDDLESKGRKRFYAFITPHHGTHWSKSLENIKCTYAISSNGSKLGPGKRDFKKISEKLFVTKGNGDIVLPPCLMGMIGYCHSSFME